MKSSTLLFLLLTLFISCGNIDLTEENKKDTEKSEKVFTDTLTVAEVQGMSTDEEICVKGYIIGYCSGTTLSSATDETPSQPNTNFILSDSPDVFEMGKVMVIRLNSSHKLHGSWNLFHHPEHFRTLVAVTGKPASYFSTTGIKEVKSITRLANVPSVVPSPTPQPGEPNAHKKDTISVADFHESGKEGTVYCIKGYIVGFVDGMSLKNATFNAPNRENTNLLLADSPNERDVSKMIPVKLLKGEERDTFNLQKQPNLLGSRVTIEGYTGTYFKVLGVIKVLSWKINPANSQPDKPNTDQPVTPKPPQEDDSVKLPTISDSTAVIPGGRVRPMRRKQSYSS